MIEIKFVLVLVTSVVVFFLRFGADVFDLPKATLLWTASPLVVGAAISSRRAATQRNEKPILIVVGVYWFAAVLATTLSMDPRASLFGQSQRYTGLVTISVAIGIFLVASRQGDQIQSRTLRRWLSVALAIHVGYSLLQASGRDPFLWSTSSFGNLVFGTMGNPNTASALVAVLIPFSILSTLQKSTRLVERIVSAAIFVSGIIALGLYQSIQGPLSALASSLLLLAVAATYRTWTMIGLASTIQLQIISPIIFSSSPLFVLMHLAITLLVVIVAHNQHKFGIWNSEIPVTIPRLVIPALALATSVVVLFRERLLGELKLSFVERGDFYRAAFDSFIDKPLTGHGVETFGFVFTRFRPESHALTLEESRTSSAHNAILSALSSGGVILGIAFVALVVSISIVGLQAFRTSDSAKRIWVATLGSSWVAILLQSMVSVDHVALLILQFFVGGLLVAQAPRRSLRLTGNQKTGRVRGSRGTKSTKSAAGLVRIMLLPFAAMVVIAPVATRYFRASLYSYEGLQAMNLRNDISSAANSYKRAVGLAPWDGFYHSQLADAYLKLGDEENARRELLLTAQRTHYSGALGPEIATFLINMGYPDDGLNVARETVLSDPYAPTVVSSVTQIFDFVASQTQYPEDVRRRASELKRELAL